MKTNQIKSELKSRPEQVTKNQLPRIDFPLRQSNRRLHTERVIALLRKEKFFALAEVVGKWVWIRFEDKQPVEVTSVLAQLGFHWNNRRQVWQHPCGTPTKGDGFDPRRKYGSYFPAKAA
jgi:hypothetical protein